MSWPEALPRKNMGVTTAVARTAIKSKAIRSECRVKHGLEMAANPWGLALSKTGSDDIAMRARLTLKF